MANVRLDLENITGTSSDINDVLPTLSTEGEKVISSAEIFIRKNLLSQNANTINELNADNNKERQVAIRTEALQSMPYTPPKNTLPDNKRLNYYLENSKNPSDKNFNSSFSSPNSIKQDVQNTDNIFHISKPLSELGVKKYKELRSELQKINHPKATQLLKTLKLINAVKGTHDGYFSVYNRYYVIKHEKFGTIELLYNKKILKYPTENFEKYKELFLQNIPEEKFRNEKLFLVKNIDYRELTGEVKKYAKVNFKKFQEQNPNSNISEEEFKKLIVSVKYEDERSKLLDEDFIKKPSVEKILQNIPLNDVVETQLYNPKLQKEFFEKLNENKDIKVQIKYAQAPIPENEQVELIIRSGIMHRDMILFTENPDLKDVKTVHAGLKKQQEENIDKADKLGLFSCFTSKEISEMKNKPIEILTYVNGKYAEHPLNKEINPPEKSASTAI
jgi:hypothetical protein